MLELTKNFTNSDRLRLMLHEAHSIIRMPKYWIAFVFVVLAATIAAPFDSGEEFTPMQRFFYWCGVLGVTLLPTIVFARISTLFFVEQKIRADISSLLAGALWAIPVGLVVFIINSFIAGNDDGEADDLVRIILYCAPICMSISYVACILLKQEFSDRSASFGELVEPLQRRLPAPLRGTVIFVHAQGHYVQVTTTKGSHLILMRLSDAISELDPGKGFQIHRSWWINASAVTRITRDGNRMTAYLQDGQNVPVGRSFQRKIGSWWGRDRVT